MLNSSYFPSFPYPSSHFHFLALVSFLARSKLRIPILGLSLLRNRMETLATQAIFGVFCWFQRRFTNQLRDLFLSDGVHVNKAGQLILYRSYRNAILSALKYLKVSHFVFKLFDTTLTAIFLFLWTLSVKVLRDF